MTFHKTCSTPWTWGSAQKQCNEKESQGQEQQPSKYNKCQCPDPTAIQKKSVRNHSYLPFFWTWGVGMRNNALLLKRGKTIKPRKPFEWCKELLHRKDRGQGTSMSKCHVNIKASMGILWFRWNLVQKGSRLQERARSKHVKEKKGLNFLGRHWLIIS